MIPMAIVTVDMLRANSSAALRRALHLGCDFDVGEGEYMYMPLESDIIVDAAGSHELIAGEGAGGRYVLLAPSGHLLYISSEAEAGVIAPGLTEAIALLAAVPHWQDLLVQSAGDLARMRELDPQIRED